jgi:hypothetical protein
MDPDNPLVVDRDRVLAEAEGMPRGPEGRESEPLVDLMSGTFSRRGGLPVGNDGEGQGRLRADLGCSTASGLPSEPPVIAQTATS